MRAWLTAARRARAAGVLGTAVLAIGLAPGTSAAAVSDPIDPTVPMAVSSWGAERLDLFAKGTDGTLKHKVYNGRWSGWESLGGAITSGPAAVSWAPGRIDVVARGVNQDVQHIAYTSGTWNPWESKGGVIKNEPSITSWGAGHLDIYVRGGNDAVYHKGYSGGAWQTSWTSIGGVVTSSPSATSWGTSRIDIFVRGGGNALFHKWYDHGSWGPSGATGAWENLAGSLTSAPAAISFETGHLDVYVRNTNNQISHKYHPAGGSWSGYAGIGGGTMQTAPAAVDWANGHVDVFARGTDGTNQHTFYSSGWKPWVAEPDSSLNLPVPSYSRTVAMQATPAAGAQVGSLEYSYVDNIGRIVSGRQSDPGNANSVQWTVISGNEAFTGPPGLVEQPDGRLQVTALHTHGDLWARAQTAKGAATWTNWLDQGGQMMTPVTVARQTDGSLVQFAVDPAGGLWYLPQSSVAGPYGIWRKLGSTALVGSPSVIAGQNGLQIFGVDGTGAIQTATLFPAGTVSAWTSLGGTGYSGTPALVIYPGYRVRVFVRAADGTIATKVQDGSLAWPAAWSPVGTQVAAGAPAAVLSPLSGKTEVLVRSPEGNIWSTGEIAQGSDTWRDWSPVLQGGDVAATDPTILSYNDGAGLRWAFTFRTADQQSRLYTVDTGTFALAASTVDALAFTRSALPVPPA